MVCAYAKQDGRGNLRVAKTPPLQSGVCGDIVAFRIALQMPTMASSMRIACHPWRHAFFTTTRHGKGGHSRVGGQRTARPYQERVSESRN